VLLPIIATAALSLAAWAAVITGPCIALGRIITRALARLIKGPKE
jgi:hypothetical protein